jgi:hypothetical protein
VALRIFRVLVRGRFGPLDADARARLLAEADRHTVAESAFTETGTLTYDRTLSSFGFRIQVRVRADDDAEDAAAEAEAVALGERAACAELDRLGAGAAGGDRDLRTTASDMAAVWARQGGGTPGRGGARRV